MIDPALDRGGDHSQFNVTRAIVTQLLAQTALEGNPLAPFDAPVVRVEHKAEKRNTLGDWLWVATRFMQGKAQPGQEIDERSAPLSEQRLIVSKEQEVIDKAQIGRALGKQARWQTH